VALLALAAGAAAGGYALTRPTPVSVARSTTGEAVDAVYASGVVEYVRQARLAPVVTAPILAVMAAEGDTVRAGQVLARLNDGPQQGTTLQLEAQAAQARADARRMTRLFEAGFAAPAAREDAVSRMRAAEAAAASARARLRDYIVVAPFAGTVLRRDAEPGDLAAVGTPLFVIARTGDIRVRADVDERDVARLTVGQSAQLRSDAFPGRTFPARISEITPQGDSSGRVFRARLGLDPQTPLRPGMTVEANLIVARRPNVVLVPTKALKEGGVWKVEGGRVHRAPVRTGSQGAEMTEVLSGLAAGAVVVVEPPAGLRENGRVAIRGQR